MSELTQDTIQLSDLFHQSGSGGEHRETLEPESHWDYTEEASQLRDDRRDLDAFRVALRRVFNMRQAELLAAKLREKDPD
ncbi:hypothetical protein ACFORG_03985 [Lutimaribacter marinistellae]|uniref:Uncharacterized protein n=1 Tax=Lutimaribacter marinistellae TaxID=1820329 RepID=A0ABV7TE23_9RHOB